MKYPHSEWYNDPDYWEANRSFIWSKKRIEMSEAAAEKITELLDIQSGESILDMACGFGRHSLALSQKGYSVTGIDLNPDFIIEARKKANDLNLDALFECADMLDFVERDGFDHIIFMYNSFGYFLDPEDDKRVLQNSLLSLRPGGKLVLQVPSREGIMRSRTSQHFRYWHEENNGKIRLEEATTNDDWTWNTTRWIILDGSERQEYTYGMRLYDRTELCSLLDSIGFCEIKTYSSISGKPYSKDVPHIVVVAHKA